MERQNSGLNAANALLNSDDFVAKSDVEFPFKPQVFDQEIQKDTSVYRVYNLNERLDQGARTSYFHHSIGGYHGAKMGKYQYFQ